MQISSKVGQLIVQSNRISANTIEEFVVRRIKTLLLSADELLTTVRRSNLSITQQSKLIDHATYLANEWETKTAAMK